MPWYKSGTVSVVLNSNAVIGAGTAFIANSRVGDAFRGPDGGWYEVTNIASDTALSISPNYQGATNATGTYALAPMQGYVKDSADSLRAIVNTYGTKLAALGTTGNYDILPASKGGTGADSADAALTAFGFSPFIKTLINDADQATARGTLAAAQSGANNDILSLAGMTTALSIAQGGTGSKLAKDAHISLNMRGIRNMLINADFMINQVAYAGAATSAAGQYVYDMWKVNVSGQSAPLSVSGVSNTVTAPVGGLVQIIEALNVVGGVCTLSWSGSATASVTQSSITTPVANGGQVSLAAGVQCFVTFTSGTVKEPQLEAGPFQTKFDQVSPASSMAECQRYFEVIYCCMLGYGLTNDLMGGSFNYKVRKRTTPTATLFVDGSLIANLNVGALGQQVYQDLIIVYRNIGATGHSRWSEGYYISARL